MTPILITNTINYYLCS